MHDQRLALAHEAELPLPKDLAFFVANGRRDASGPVERLGHQEKRAAPLAVFLDLAFVQRRTKLERLAPARQDTRAARFGQGNAQPL